MTGTGPPHFLSPELVKRRSGHCHARVDVGLGFPSLPHPGRMGGFLELSWVKGLMDAIYRSREALGCRFGSETEIQGRIS